MDPLEMNPAHKDAPLRFPFGTCTQLLTVAPGPSELCGCRHGQLGVLKGGELTVVALRVCFIEQQHWHVGKDSTVHHFCLPGLLYGLTLPESRISDEPGLEQMLQRACCIYQDHAVEEDSLFPKAKSEGRFLGDMDHQRPQPYSFLLSYCLIRLRRGSGVGAAKALAPAPGPRTYGQVGTPTAQPTAIARIRLVTDIVKVPDAVAQARAGSPVPVPRRWLPADPFWTLYDVGVEFILQVVTVKASGRWCCPRRPEWGQW